MGPLLILKIWIKVQYTGIQKLITFSVQDLFLKFTILGLTIIDEC